MKIIDLLNKIANDEEVPKKIKVKDFFELERTSSNSFLEYYIDKDGGFLFKNYSYELDENIEIIEEEKKIEYEDIQELGNNFTFENIESELSTTDYKCSIISQYINKLIRNQKKLIDQVNKLKEEK